MMLQQCSQGWPGGDEVTHSNSVDGNVDVHEPDATLLIGWRSPPGEGEAKLDLVVLSDSDSDSDSDYEYSSEEEDDTDMEENSDDEHGEKDSDEHGEKDSDEHGKKDSEILTAVTLVETDVEIQEEIDALLQHESEAAELQEMMEEESLARVRYEATLELSEKFADPDLLAAATEQEMSVYQNIVEEDLLEVEEYIIGIQERLDAAGISLPAIYKEIEKQAPDHCKTDAWKKRAHWAGLQETSEVLRIIKDAESELEKSRPVTRLRGRTFEAGASGMLAKKFGLSTSAYAPVDQGWRAFDARTDADEDAKIYGASTPQQAAQLLGPEVPAADEVEEISEWENAAGPFSEALKNEGETGLTNTQRENLKQIDEQNDARKYTAVKPSKRKGEWQQ